MTDDSENPEIPGSDEPNLDSDPTAEETAHAVSEGDHLSDQPPEDTSETSEIQDKVESDESQEVPMTFEKMRAFDLDALINEKKPTTLGGWLDRRFELKREELIAKELLVLEFVSGGIHNSYYESWRAEMRKLFRLQCRLKRRLKKLPQEVLDRPVVNPADFAFSPSEILDRLEAQNKVAQEEEPEAQPEVDKVPEAS